VKLKGFHSLLNVFNIELSVGICDGGVFFYIYIRPLSSVQNKLRVMNGSIKSCKSSLCVPTLYVYMSKCYFINVKRKHEERLIFD